MRKKEANRTSGFQPVPSATEKKDRIVQKYREDRLRADVLPFVILPAAPKYLREGGIEADESLTIL